MRGDLEAVFRAANARLLDLPPERCRELELGQLRALQVLPPRPPMLRQLLAALKEGPATGAHRQRCHDTLRRLYVRLQREGADADTFRLAANGYLDGQHDVAARWLDLDTLLRPWGVR